jgi:hypothetical protein
MKVSLAAMVALAAFVSSGFAQEARLGNGLEIAGDLRARVVVETLPDDAVRLGMVRDALALRCEQVLESHGVAAMDEERFGADPSSPEVRVTVRVEGLTYSCAVEFRRSVSYPGGDGAYVTTAPVWRRATPEARVMQLSYVANVFPSWRRRSHEPGGRVANASYVVDAVLGLVDAFCIEFRAANPR